ncbi:thioredoxin family protein [Brevibacillus laterosporus]|uniref:Thioredoxin family protein n=1 Tax=Brevibacillus halotolerans TaxID=1507437 RepID=A0ABT4HTT8_9BACL|nr:MULTISPECIES: thioredoxin family protein [Brevibacillus]MCR8984448.1 thioredoxin family protein [Brevibacillus laterosporus]MCZ0830172.1 thioredoxin family protein [Brevibacillus halotolerans]
MKECVRIEELEQALQTFPLCLVLLTSKNCSVCEAVEQKLHTWLSKDQPLDPDELQSHILEGFHVSKASIDKLPELSGRFLAFSGPTILVFAYGKEIYRQARFIHMQELSEALEQAKVMIE